MKTLKQYIIGFILGLSLIGITGFAGYRTYLSELFMDGNINMQDHSIKNIKLPVDNKDVASKEYVDASVDISNSLGKQGVYYVNGAEKESTYACKKIKYSEDDMFGQRVDYAINYGALCGDNKWCDKNGNCSSDTTNNILGDAKDYDKGKLFYLGKNSEDREYYLIFFMYNTDTRIYYRDKGGYGTHLFYKYDCDPDNSAYCIERDGETYYNNDGNNSFYYEDTDNGSSSGKGTIICNRFWNGSTAIFGMLMSNSNGGNYYYYDLDINDLKWTNEYTTNTRRLQLKCSKRL